MPSIPNILVKVGFGAESIRAFTLSSGVRDFPTVGVPSPTMRIVHAPIAGKIARSASVPVQIAWPDASDIVVVQGDVWPHRPRRALPDAAALSGELVPFEGALGA